MKNNNLGFSRSLSPRSHFPYSIQNLFQDFFGDSESNDYLKAESEFVPRLNVSETDLAYKVMVELPGMEEKDFDVTIEDNLLRIKGEKKAETENKDEHYHRFESSYGSFERILRLPEAIDSEASKASFKNGILTLEIPKDKEISRVKKLKISS
jgi:HSP20 family protein